MNRPPKRNQGSSRALGLCAICSRFTERIETDHPLQRSNYPEYTIPLCLPDHREVTRLDNITRRNFTVESSVAMFMFTLHRLQLTFDRHNLATVAELLRAMETNIITSHGYTRSEKRGKNRAKFPLTGPSNYLVLANNVMDWIEHYTNFVNSRDPSMISLIDQNYRDQLSAIIQNQFAGISDELLKRVQQAAELIKEGKPESTDRILEIWRECESVMTSESKISA